MRLTVLAVCLVLAAVAAGGWTASPAQAGPNCGVPGTIDSEEYLLLGYINQHRANNGLGGLVLSDTLNKAASWKSWHMANYNYFAHDDTPIGRTWVQRIRDCGYTYNTWLGENIAAGNSGAYATFEQWRNSPGHNANMLNGDYTTIGIGRAYSASSPYGWYWTTDFGGYADGYTPPTQPTPTPTSTPTPLPTNTPTNTPLPSDTPTPASTATPTPTATDTAVPPPTATATPPGPDTDGDGCGDAAETGDVESHGGKRDPANPWDFFDTPDGQNVRDAQITAADLYRVLGRFGASDDGGTAPVNRTANPHSPPPASGYHPAFDRGALVGAFPWNRGPADGAIAADDIFAAIAQFGHSCS